MKTKLKKMTLIELYNDTTTIQCETQADANEVLEMYLWTDDPLYMNLLQREIEVEEVIIPLEPSEGV